MEKYYYTVPYECICEVCGKKFSGLIRRGPLEYASRMLPNVMEDVINAGDMVLSRNLIQHKIEGIGNQPFEATNANSCPHCGVRQSWYPLKEPKKYNGIGFLFLTAFFGLMLGLLVWAIAFEADSEIAFFVCLGIGLLLGIVPMAIFNRKHKLKREKDYYSEAEEYHKFTESLKNRTQKNTPDIHWDMARRENCN